MAKFIYKAKKGPEEVLEGTIEADSKNIAVNKLIQSGYYPIWVKEEAVFSTRPFPRLRSGQVGPRSNNILRASREDLYQAKIRSKDISNFTRQLSELLNSGIGLYNALNVIENQAENHYLKALISNVKNHIKDGKTFSEALKNYPGIFSNVYVNLVRSGEEAGSLDEVLGSLAEFLEKEEDIKSKIIASLAYPILIAIVGFLTIFILLAFVVPKIVHMFGEMGQNLPLPTKILIGLSGFIRTYWFLLIIGIISTILFLRNIKSNKLTKDKIDMMRLKIPIFGNLIRLGEFARFSRTLSMLIKNGVPILPSLKISHDIIGNNVIREETGSVYHDVQAGSTLTAAMRKKKSLPVFLINMALIGEEGGFLDRALLHVAQTYEKEIDRLTKVITALLEPVLILTIGLVVGFIVIAMLLPVFQLSLVAH